MGKSKMYEENPRLAHDEDGNVKVKKDAPKAEAAGDTGEPDGAGIEELLKQHKEMKDMHDKHQADMMARIKKKSAEIGTPNEKDGAE